MGGRYALGKRAVCSRQEGGMHCMHKARLVKGRKGGVGQLELVVVSQLAKCSAIKGHFSLNRP